METQTPFPAEQPERDARASLVWYMAGAAMALNAVIDFRDGDRMRAVNDLSFAAVWLLIAPGHTPRSRAKTLVIYTLLAISVGLMVARHAR
jgi:hypothetical protein